MQLLKIRFSDRIITFTNNSRFHRVFATQFDACTPKNFGNHAGIMLDLLTTVLRKKLCRCGLSEHISDRQIASIKVYQISLFLLLVSSVSQGLFGFEDWVASLQMS